MGLKELGPILRRALNPGLNTDGSGALALPPEPYAEALLWVADSTKVMRVSGDDAEIVGESDAPILDYLRRTDSHLKQAAGDAEQICVDTGRMLDDRPVLCAAVSNP